MASQPQPGSTHRTATQAPPPASVNAPAYRSYMQKCVVLLDWWVERVEGRDGKVRVAGFTSRNRAARVFTSGSISMRHADGTLETVDDKIVLIRGPLNIPRMQQNGFPDEVSECFQLGFPVQWEKYVNSNMKPTNGHAQSPSKSTEYYIEKFLHGSFKNSMGYIFTGNDFNTSKGSTGNTDGPPIRRLSNLSNGTTRFQESTGDYDNSMSNMAASEEVCNGRVDMPDESFADPRPGETCNNGQAGQADNQHEGMHIDASEQEIINQSIGCVLVKQSTGSICSDSKVDGKRSEASEIASFKKGDYRNRVQHGAQSAGSCVVPAEKCGSGQTEQDAEIQHENVHIYSSEQEIVTHSVDSALANNHTAQIIFDLEECGTPKCGKTLVYLGTEEALEVPTKGMSPQFGVVQGSEDNTIRRLRNGKVYGMSNCASLKKGYSKRKTVQHETFNRKMISNEEITPPVDLTSHKNGGSVARIIATDKLQSHDSRHKGKGKPRKRARRCH